MRMEWDGRYESPLQRITPLQRLIPQVAWVVFMFLRSSQWPLGQVVIIITTLQKSYWRTQRLTCQGHTTIHDMNYLDGSFSIVNDFWVIFPNLLPPWILQGDTLQEDRQSPGSIGSGWGVENRSEIRGQVLDPPLFRYLLTLLFRDCRGQPCTPRTLLPPAVHTFSIPGFLRKARQFWSKACCFLESFFICKMKTTVISTHTVVFMMK